MRPSCETASPGAEASAHRPRQGRSPRPQHATAQPTRGTTLAGPGRSLPGQDRPPMEGDRFTPGPGGPRSPQSMGRRRRLQCNPRSPPSRDPPTPNPDPNGRVSARGGGARGPRAGGPNWAALVVPSAVGARGPTMSKTEPWSRELRSAPAGGVVATVAPVGSSLVCARRPQPAGVGRSASS